MSKSHVYDILIIGSGAAGLGLALSLADKYRIAIVCKDNGLTSSSSHAQGGIAAVMDKTDSNAAHIEDTLNTGGGLCDKKAVEFIVKNGRKAIEWLMQHGVQFTLEKTHLHLTQEGGHSHRRVVHAKDQTGAIVVKTLAEQIHEHANIDCFTEKTAIDLILEDSACVGATFLNNENSNVETFFANFVVIATGGASRLYLHTSNPGHTTGDGIAMAYRAGCRVANMEFNQFHPTSFYHPHSRPFLITEVIRGEGGKLILKDGKRFMPKYDKRAEMAPRDIVARAIHAEMQKNTIPCVYLDISHKPAEFVKQFFPTIYAHCLKAGIDMTKEPIPVVPAAHYTCGGVVTNLKGESDIPNLYVIGEAACTGLHGANRMASNSLLECLVMAMSAAKAVEENGLLRAARNDGAGGNDDINHSTLEGGDSSLTPSLRGSETTEAIHTNTIRHLMWHNVGIVRNDKDLKTAVEKLTKTKNDIEKEWIASSCVTFVRSPRNDEPSIPSLRGSETTEAIHKQHLTKESVEERNLVEVAYLAAFMAQARHESRGLHFNKDHPDTRPIARNTVMQKAKLTYTDNLQT